MEDNGKERIILSRERARLQAERHRDSGQRDPFPEIPPALFSAAHIQKYVMETGAISPFFTGGGRESRLKMATYEGRVGNYAYRYSRQGRLESLKFGEKLTVEANSIVFVECDLDFRLPYYLALRFNLQIRHVHRGLLLGTGPLVDPGYWGKLCIPLHNLTDEDYIISRDDGLIWVEFTKTSAGDQRGRPPLELHTEKKQGHWEIREFIEKASTPRNGIGESVPIRSSISGVMEQAEKAASDARAAEQSATDTKNEASRMRSNLTWIGAATGVLLVVGIVALFVSVYSSVAPRIDDLQSRFSYIESISTDKSLQGLPAFTQEIKDEVQALRQQVRDLEGKLAREENSRE